TYRGSRILMPHKEAPPVHGSRLFDSPAGGAYMDEQMVNVALALVGIVSILANAYAYSKRKDADGKAEAAKAEAAEAKATAEQTLTLANAINRAVDEWAASEKRAAEDRKHFTRVMEANAVQKGKL